MKPKDHDINGGKPEFDDEDEVFLRDLRKDGFVLAVLWTINADDPILKIAGAAGGTTSTICRQELESE